MRMLTSKNWTVLLSGKCRWLAIQWRAFGRSGVVGGGEVGAGYKTLQVMMCHAAMLAGSAVLLACVQSTTSAFKSKPRTS